MNKFSQQPVRLGVLAAVLANGLGLAVMAAAGAPVSYLVINTAALAIGLALLGLLNRTHATPAQAGWLCLACAAALLATALLGTTMSGATRWVQVGVVALQPSLLLLAVMIMAYARHQNAAGTAAMLLAALALALQPDRAMAAALVAGLLALASTASDRRVKLALAAALAGFAATMLRGDTLPPSRFVEQVFADAFAASLLAGAALVAGAALMLLPARALPIAEARVFAAVWLTLLLASVLGNYPTPLLGYGGSGILGYLLCLAVLRSRPLAAGEHAQTGENHHGGAPGGDAIVAVTP
jgi:cell division protein FtsW (lipid II flippase)